MNKLRKCYAPVPIGILTCLLLTLSIFSLSAQNTPSLTDDHLLYIKEAQPAPASGRMQHPGTPGEAPAPSRLPPTTTAPAPST